MKKDSEDLSRDSLVTVFIFRSFFFPHQLSSIYNANVECNSNNRTILLFSS